MQSDLRIYSQLKAVNRDNLEFVQVLLESGANPRLKNAEGHTATDVAIRKGYFEIALGLFVFKATLILC